MKRCDAARGKPLWDPFIEVEYFTAEVRAQSSLG